MKIRLSGRGAIAACVIVLLALAGGLLYLLWPQEDLSGTDGVGTQTQWFDDNTLYLNDTLYGFTHRMETYLFAGTDDSGSREGEAYHGAMADFLMLLVMDHTAGSYGVIQIDRNTMTEVPMPGPDGRLAGWRDMQICTANWYGDSPAGSAENLAETVQNLVGELEVLDGYYVLNMHDIAVLNEAVDGVEVKIEDPDLAKIDPAFTPGSTVKLSGEQAEKFVRARMDVGGGTNRERMDRQRIYLKAFFDKAAERIYDNPKAVQKFWNTVRECAVTDMNGNDVSRIAKMVMDGENKGFYAFEGETKTGFALDDGIEHEEFYPDPDSVVQVMTELFSLVQVEEEEDLSEDISEALTE